MSEEDLLRIARKLEKMASSAKSAEGVGRRPEDDGALELLRALEKMPVTLEALQKSRIGMTINDLRKKTKSEEFASLAKSLIKSWKKMLDNKPKNGSGAEEGSLPRSESFASTDGSSRDSSDYTEIRGSKGPKQTQFPPPSGSSDPVRTKCTEMLLNSLTWTELPDGTLDAEEIAQRLENRLLDIHKGTSDKYKAAVRSRVFNLRDKKNPELRENILTGVISPEKFATMTSDEMASQEVKDQRQKFTKEAINEHQMVMESGTATEMFKCGKCHQKNCTYTQVQTRSADEPMTTFVFCRECGNRWKFY